FENGLTATLRDSKGMNVKKIALQNTINPIEIGSWAQGIYFIEINTRKGQSSLFKLVKN
ncbi:MAG: T9SS type A sorting domain-containing protein, partial [Flavobacteriales bacterium]